MRLKVAMLGIVLFQCISVLAQEDSFPCQCCNPDLKSLFQGKTLKSLYVHACYGQGLHLMSSSFLKASGTPPKIIEHPGDAPDDAEYVAWTCKYSAGNLMDGDPATAWVEGMDDYGIGEVIIAPCLELNKKVEIWGGFGKSQALYAANSRPKKIKVAVVRAKYGGASQYGTYYNELSIVAQQEVELKDVNGYQSLIIPTFKVQSYFWEEQQENREYNYFLGIQILDVYKGAKYSDTCISEIRNY